jgi:lysophospholipase L1-like esterase
MTAVDIQLFILAAKPATNLADPPRLQKLVWLEMVLSVTSIVMIMVGLLALKPASIQRQLFAGAQPVAQVLWGVLGAYVLLVYYPLPPHAHHTEKALLASGILLLWSVLVLFRPGPLRISKASRAFAWIRTVSINVLVFIVIGEVVLRVADPLLASQGFFGGKHTPAHMKPHTPVLGSIGRSNSQGFRDRERAVDRNGIIMRVVAIGDSQTYGAGVTYDDAFPTLLEKRLQAVESRSEVINLGVPGWEPPEELHLLKVYGMQFTPDLVLVNFFVGNDIIRRRGAYLERPMVVGGQSYYVHATGNKIHDTASPDRWFLYHHLNYLIQVGSVHLKTWRQEPLSEGADLGITLRSRSGYLQELDERTDIYLLRPPEEIQRQWERTDRTLTEFRDTLRAQGIRMLLVLLPDHVQVDQKLREEFLAARREDSNSFDFDRPQRLLREWGERHDVQTIDLLPRFRDSASVAPLFYETDLHMTTAGHRLVAEGIWPLLSSALSLPEEMGAGASR